MWFVITALGTALMAYVGNDIVDIYQATAENPPSNSPKFLDRFKVTGFIWKFLAVAGVIGTAIFFFISKAQRRRIL